MIDISTEHLIPISDVPRRLPPRPTGRRVHISAVYRWIQRGVRGTCLESIKIGGTAYTSSEALQRFADGLSQTPAAQALPPRRTTATRQKQIAAAAKAVDEILNGRCRNERATRQ